MKIWLNSLWKLWHENLVSVRVLQRNRFKRIFMCLSVTGVGSLNLETKNSCDPPGESCRTRKASGMSWWCLSPKAREPRGQECECWCDSESLGPQAGEDGCLSSSREGKSAFFHLLIPLTPSLGWIMSTSIKNSLLCFVCGFKYESLPESPSQTHKWCFTSYSGHL